MVRVSSAAMTVARSERLDEPPRRVAQVADGGRRQDDHGPSLRLVPVTHAPSCLSCPATRPCRPTIGGRRGVSADPRLARRWAWLAPTLVTVLAGDPAPLESGASARLHLRRDVLREGCLDAVACSVMRRRGRRGRTRASSRATPTASRRTAASSCTRRSANGSSASGWGCSARSPRSDGGSPLRSSAPRRCCVLYFVAKSLSGSIAFATVASFLMAIDGLAIVLSRVALLDIFLAFFVLLAFWFVLLDRRDHMTRLAALVHARSSDREAPAWGPVLWSRPWVMAAGVALGAGDRGQVVGPVCPRGSRHLPRGHRRARAPPGGHPLLAGGCRVPPGARHVRAVRPRRVRRLSRIMDRLAGHRRRVRAPGRGPFDRHGTTAESGRGCRSRSRACGSTTRRSTTSTSA